MRLFGYQAMPNLKNRAIEYSFIELITAIVPRSKSGQPQMPRADQMQAIYSQVFDPLSMCIGLPGSVDFVSIC